MPETQTKDAIETRVIEALVEFGEERENVTRDSRFEELDVDSLDLVELAQILEDEYGVEVDDAQMEQLKTVGDAIDLVAARTS